MPSRPPPDRPGQIGARSGPQDATSEWPRKVQGQRRITVRLLPACSNRSPPARQIGGPVPRLPLTVAASGRDRRDRAGRRGQVGPNPVCLHPSPEAAQHHAQQLTLAPLVPLLWPADEPPWPCAVSGVGRTTRSHRAEDGYCFVRSTTRCFAAAGLEVMRRMLLSTPESGTTSLRRATRTERKCTDATPGKAHIYSFWPVGQRGLVTVGS
jgi:hypothetical protein